MTKNTIHNFGTLTLIGLLFISLSIKAVTPDRRTALLLDGFSSESSLVEKRWEEQFRAVPQPKSAREHLRRLTLEPHIAGSKEDYATAIYVRDQLRSYGLNAELREY